MKDSAGLQNNLISNPISLFPPPITNTYCTYVRVDTNSFILLSTVHGSLPSSAARRLVASKYQQDCGFNFSYNVTTLSRSPTSKGVFNVGQVEDDEEEGSDAGVFDPGLGPDVDSTCEVFSSFLSFSTTHLQLGLAGS